MKPPSADWRSPLALRRAGAGLALSVVAFVVIVAAGVPGTGLPGTGASNAGSGASAAPGRSGRAAADALVTERDFHITAPEKVRAGEVVLHVHNLGPDDHELLVVRAGHGELPLRGDGLTVDEDKLEPRTIGVLEAGEPGARRTLRVHLKPGRYELFCNMSGHYLGGMETDIEVPR